MNNVVLVGRLARDPELRYTSKDSRPVVNFTLAVNRPFAKDDEADFLRIVAWGKQAEHIAKYLTKGSLCAVTGFIVTGSYEDNDGNTRYTFDINASWVEFLGGGKKSDAKDSESTQETGQNNYDGFPSVDDEDIPF